MAGTLVDLIRGEVGGRAAPRINDQLSSVGATAARLWIQDGDRVANLAVNLSANVLFVGPFPNVSSTRGIRLNPNGGYLYLRWKEDLDIVAWEWFVVADAAASALLSIEWILSP